MNRETISILKTILLEVDNPISVLKNYFQGTEYTVHIDGTTITGTRGDGTLHRISQARQQGYHFRDSDDTGIHVEKDGFHFYLPELGILLDEDLHTYLDETPQEKVVDIGGLCGETAILFRQAGWDSVVVYEPVPENIDFIEKNVALNGFEDTVTIHEKMVSARPGKATVDSKYPAGSRAFGIGSGSHSLEAEATSWKEVVDEHADADLFKVDCEGGEQHLTTVPPEDLKNIPLWIIESHSREITQNLTEHFKKAGFEAQNLRAGQENYTRLLRFKLE